MVSKTASRSARGVELTDLLASFTLSLRAANKAPRTIETYCDSLVQLIDFLSRSGLSIDATKLTRGHLEMFEVSLMERGRQPATVSVRHRSLQAFFKWAVSEREIAQSPMAGMAAPIVPDLPVPVPPDESLKKLLGSTTGSSFERMRDAALLRLFIDTGIRASEGINLRVEDIDLTSRIPVAYVVGKGRRPRAVPVGAKTALAIDRYLRVRRSHPNANLEWLWIGARGRLTTSGLRQLLERRCDQAQIPRIHAHQLRHHFAHSWLAQNGAENELMALTGWKSRAMLSRYAASTVAERAAESHRRLSPGDKF